MQLATCKHAEPSSIWRTKRESPATPIQARAGAAYGEGEKKFKIIVIDDESLIAETVVEILNDQGFEAMSVSSGASAIELAKTVRPAIVLSDVIMPGLERD